MSGRTRISDVKSLFRYQIAYRLNNTYSITNDLENSIGSMRSLSPVPDEYSKCRECSKEIRMVKTTQNGYRIHQVCHDCGIVTTALENVKHFLSNEEEYGDAITEEDLEHNTKFVQQWTDAKHEIHPTYQSVCVMFDLLNSRRKGYDARNEELLPCDFLAYSGVYQKIAAFHLNFKRIFYAMKIGSVIFISNSEFFGSVIQSGIDAEKKTRRERRERDGILQTGNVDIRQYQLVSSILSDDTSNEFRLLSIAEVDDFEDGKPVELKHSNSTSTVMMSKNMTDTYRKIGFKMILGNIDKLEYNFVDGQARKVGRDDVYASACSEWERWGHRRPWNSRNPIDASFDQLTLALRTIRSSLEHMQVCNVVVGEGEVVIRDVRSVTTEGLLPEFIDLIRARGM